MIHEAENPQTCWFHDGHFHPSDPERRTRATGIYYCNSAACGKYMCYECAKFHGWRGSHRLRKTATEKAEARSEYHYQRNRQKVYGDGVKTKDEQIADLERQVAELKAAVKSYHVQFDKLEAENYQMKEEMRRGRAGRQDDPFESFFRRAGVGGTAPKGELAKAFAVFGLLPSVSRDIFDGYYRLVIMKYHPDRNQSADATKRTQEFNAAKDTIYKLKGWK